jgi:hypothetical protein
MIKLREIRERRSRIPQALHAGYKSAAGRLSHSKNAWSSGRNHTRPPEKTGPIQRTVVMDGAEAMQPARNRPAELQ